MFLEIAHQSALLHEIGLTEHFVVESDLLLVIELSVVCGLIRQDLCTSSSGLTTLWQLPASTTSKLPCRMASNQGPVGTTRWVT